MNIIKVFKQAEMRKMLTGTCLPTFSLENKLLHCIKFCQHVRMCNYVAENIFPFLVNPVCSRMFNFGVTVGKLIGDVDIIFLKAISSNYHSVVP